MLLSANKSNAFLQDVLANGLPSLQLSRPQQGPSLKLHPIRRVSNPSSVEWEFKCVSLSHFCFLICIT